MRSTSPPQLSVIPDLLADTGAEINTRPLEPLSAVMAKEDSDGSHVLASEASLPTPEADAADDEPAPNADTTIRLIGGGGQAGISPPSPVEPTQDREEMAEPSPPAFEGPTGVDSDAASISEPTSDADAAKKHKKSKSSLASLKRFSQIGKKRNSASSTKEVK